MTKTDVPASEWLLDDAVTRLREWGTDTVCELGPSEITIGADETCTLRLDDPAGRISRRHAELVRSDARWLLRDCGSKNGLRIDGARQLECQLRPGAEIGIGPRTLIAESDRSLVLRGFLSRMLGWHGDRIAAVDHALRSLRTAAAHRGSLVLCGDGDLVPIAHALHRVTLGTDRPFIVCDPRRRRGKATVRAAANFESGMEALAAAAGGSLCVRGYRLPKDFHRVIDALRTPAWRVQLIVCSPGAEDHSQFFAVPITVPPLASRLDEIDRIVDEYAGDALRDLDAPRELFTAADRTWVRTYSAKSLPDIEKGAIRLVSLHLSRNLSEAAERLGMAPVSLSRWIGRRTLPNPLAP
ncbi:MAG TPA: FHA domain-containing protein [Kofleriaceae bacterium]